MSTKKCWKNSGLKMFSGSGSYFFRAVSWTHLKLSNTNDATHLSTGLNLATKQEEKKTPTKIYIYILYILYIYIHIRIHIAIYMYDKIAHNYPKILISSQVIYQASRPVHTLPEQLECWAWTKTARSISLVPWLLQKDPEIIAYSSGPPQTLVDSGKAHR